MANYRDVRAVDGNGAIVDVNVGNATTRSFNLKVKLTSQTDDGPKDFEIMVSLKYLSNFWRTLQMTLINCEISLDLNLSVKCVIVANNAN